MNSVPPFKVGERVTVSLHYLEINCSMSLDTWVGKPCVIERLQGTWANLRLEGSKATLRVPKRTLRRA